MVLCPEFLPRDEAPARPPAPRPSPEPAPPARLRPQPAARARTRAGARAAPAGPAAPIRERLSGTLQYVFGNDPGFSMDETFGGAVDAASEPEEPRTQAPRAASRRTTSEAARAGQAACARPASGAARTIRPMQRAVAIALAGGLLAASAGAFGLAQVLKLERSPIEAIQVDPTPNHGRGQLDRHDSALFSPSLHRALPAGRARAVQGAHVRAGARAGDRTGRGGRARPRDARRTRRPRDRALGRPRRARAPSPPRAPTG